MANAVLIRESRINDFWANVDKTGDCWFWLAMTDKEGYGRFNCPEVGVGRLAHRIAYVLTYGPFDRKLNVCHSCDNPPCVNPYHLFLGTDKDNAIDAKNKGRLATRANGRINPNRYIARGAEMSKVLSDADALAIRSRYAEGGISCSKLAQSFGVSDTSVSAILRGVTWQHLEDGLQAAIDYQRAKRIIRKGSRLEYKRQPTGIIRKSY